MALKIWNGSAWTQASAVKVWNGSAWVSAIAGKVWDGSAWNSFLSTVALPGNPYSLTGAAPSTATASATLRFRSTGTIESIVTRLIGGTTTTSLGTWLLGGAASDYNLVLTSGDVSLLNTGAGNAYLLSTPYNLASTTSISLSNDGSAAPLIDSTISQTYGFNLTNSGGSTLISGTVTLTANYTGPPV